MTLTELVIELMLSIGLIDPSGYTCITGKNRLDCWKTCFSDGGTMLTNDYCALVDGNSYTCTKCTYTEAVGNWCTSTHKDVCPYK